MKPEEIKEALHRKGYSISLIAEALDVGIATVSGTVAGHTQSRNVAEAIAKLLDKPLIEVFPNQESYHRPPRLIGEARVAKLAEVKQLLAS